MIAGASFRSWRLIHNLVVYKLKMFTKKRKTYRDQRTSKTLQETVDLSVCGLCLAPPGNEEEFGKFFKDEAQQLAVHQFCLFFGSALAQNGEDHEGFDGFLYQDIKAEIKRASRLKCTVCLKKGASIGCSVLKCRSCFHYCCGLKRKALFQFFGSFRVFCRSHRPVQDNPIPSTSDLKCPICLCNIRYIDDVHSISSPCCKNACFHRACLQKQALSSGSYFFRCALCNNLETFQQEMTRMGIYIPERDASWEQGDAYADLLHTYNKCDNETCICPQGRDFSGYHHGEKWDICLCFTCGQNGTHLKCKGWSCPPPQWLCTDCRSAFDKDNNSIYKSPTRPVYPTSTVCEASQHGQHKCLPDSTPVALKSRLLDTLSDHCNMQHVIDSQTSNVDNLKELGSSTVEQVLDIELPETFPVCPTEGVDCIGDMLDIISCSPIDQLSAFSSVFTSEIAASSCSEAEKSPFERLCSLDSVDFNDKSCHSPPKDVFHNSVSRSSGLPILPVDENLHQNSPHQVTSPNNSLLDCSSLSRFRPSFEKKNSTISGQSKNSCNLSTELSIKSTKKTRKINRKKSKPDNSTSKIPSKQKKSKEATVSDLEDCSNSETRTLCNNDREQAVKEASLNLTVKKNAQGLHVTSKDNNNLNKQKKSKVKMDNGQKKKGCPKKKGRRHIDNGAVLNSKSNVDDKDKDKFLKEPSEHHTDITNNTVKSNDCKASNHLENLGTNLSPYKETPQELHQKPKLPSKSPKKSPKKLSPLKGQLDISTMLSPNKANKRKLSFTTESQDSEKSPNKSPEKKRQKKRRRFDPSGHQSIESYMMRKNPSQKQNHSACLASSTKGSFSRHGQNTKESSSNSVDISSSSTEPVLSPTYLQMAKTFISNTVKRLSGTVEDNASTRNTANASDSDTDSCHSIKVVKVITKDTCMNDVFCPCSSHRYIHQKACRLGLVQHCPTDTTPVIIDDDSDDSGKGPSRDNSDVGTTDASPLDESREAAGRMIPHCVILDDEGIDINSEQNGSKNIPTNTAVNSKKVKKAKQKGKNVSDRGQTSKRKMNENKPAGKEERHKKRPGKAHLKPKNKKGSHRNETSSEIFASSKRKHESTLEHDIASTAEDATGCKLIKESAKKKLKSISANTANGLLADSVKNREKQPSLHRSKKVNLKDYIDCSDEDFIQSAKKKKHFKLSISRRRTKEVLDFSLEEI